MLDTECFFLFLRSCSSVERERIVQALVDTPSLFFPLLEVLRTQKSMQRHSTNGKAFLSAKKDFIAAVEKMLLTP